MQDSFRATSHLTINYGLRWDYFGVVGEKNNLLSNYTSFSPAPGTGTFTLTQVGQPGLDRLYNPDKKDFAPRVSASWDVTGKGRTVVRAGFGMFFDAFSQDMVLGHLPYAPFFDPGPAYNNIGPDADLVDRCHRWPHRSRGACVRYDHRLRLRVRCRLLSIATSRCRTWKITT